MRIYAEGQTEPVELISDVEEEAIAGLLTPDFNAPLTQFDPVADRLGRLIEDMTKLQARIAAIEGHLNEFHGIELP